MSWYRRKGKQWLGIAWYQSKGPPFHPLCGRSLMRKQRNDQTNNRWRWSRSLCFELDYTLQSAKDAFVQLNPSKRKLCLSFDWCSLLLSFIRVRISLEVAAASSPYSDRSLSCCFAFVVNLYLIVPNHTTRALVIVYHTPSRIGWCRHYWLFWHIIFYCSTSRICCQAIILRIER